LVDEFEPLICINTFGWWNILLPIIMDFSQVKLKQTKMDDKSAPKLSGYDEENIKKFETNIRELYMEEWYEDLKEFTFKTKIIQITKEEAITILKCHERYKKTGEIKLLTKELESLKELFSKVDAGLTEFNNQAFLKMSSRSPKDVMNEKFDSLVKSEISKNKINDENETCFAILRAACLLLQVKNTLEVVDLLIRSERVNSDFESELERKEFKISLILREWIDIHPDLEFRGFFYKGNFTCLSQYNYTVYFQHVIDNKQIIQQRIQEFYEEIKPKVLKFQTYNEYSW
jgi:hypothetical protein